MTRSITLCGALLALLVAIPQSVEGQDRPQTREGFFIGFGLGGGSFGCEGCGDRQSGAAAHIKLGGAIRPNVLLGVESIGWTKDEGGARLSHVNVAAIVQFYPAAENGFFLKGGVGVSRLEASASGGGFSFSAGDNGLGLTAGLGYDIRLGTNFSLSPYGSFVWGDFEGGTANHVQFGLGVTWH